MVSKSQNLSLSLYTYTHRRTHRYVCIYIYTHIYTLHIYKHIYMYMEKAMAPHSSTLGWKIPWTEEPGGLQPIGSLRVGHDWATSLSLFTFMHWRRKWQPTPVFLPGESQGQGAWWAAIYGVAQSRTQLKCLSSSTRIYIHIFINIHMYKIYMYIISFLCVITWKDHYIQLLASKSFLSTDIDV